MKKRKISEKGALARQRILTAALRLFNRDGVEYVGVREIAEALEMQAGHLTYYFPGKNDIVLALAQELGELNNRTVTAAETRTLDAFLARSEAVMRNQVKYRCLMLSMPHLLTHMPEIREHYRAVATRRSGDLRERIASLIDAGVVRALDEPTLDALVGCCALLGRAWLMDCVASGHTPSTRVPHYVSLLRSLLAPHLQQPT
jgi:AcrR family transcriptional regulator